MEKSLSVQTDTDVLINSQYCASELARAKAELGRLEYHLAHYQGDPMIKPIKNRRRKNDNEIWTLKTAVFLKKLEVEHWLRRSLLYNSEMVHRCLANWSNVDRVNGVYDHEW